MNPETPQKKDNFLKEIVKFTVIALVIVIPIRAYIAQPFIVSGASMDPTFATGQYLIVDQLSYRFEDPKRDDVIIFKYPKNPKQYFIKRVIGLPGETVSVNEAGEVTIKSPTSTSTIIMKEPYVKFTNSDDVVTTLKAGEYFVMGDNRPESSDSRRWGTVPRANIIGHALVRLLPVQNIGLLPGSTPSNP